MKSDTGETLFTHQVITSRTEINPDGSESTIDSTTVVNEAKDNVMKNTPVLHSATVPVPDVDAAMNYQKSQIGKDLGKYHEIKNNCVNHVANVINAGGGNFGNGTYSQLKSLSNLGFNMKGKY